MSGTETAAVIRELNLDEIVIDPEVRVREATDEATVEEYVQAWKSGTAFPPVDVFYDEQTYRLADGVHRFLGAKRAGVKNLRAAVRPGTARDAFLFAAGCNAAHGRRRSNADKRLIVAKFLADPEWCRKSTRWIAETCRLSHTFVWHLKAELSTVDSSHAVECRDGKLRPASLPRNESAYQVPGRLAGMTLEDRQSLCLVFWDQLAKYVLLLSEAGWDVERIAGLLGMRVEEDIRPVLDPRPPVREVDEFRELSSDPEHLAEVYGRAVWRSIHFLLAQTCGMAASAAENEGQPELRAKLAEQEARHAQMAGPYAFFGDAAPEMDWKAALSLDFCAELDARVALGVEVVPKRRAMMYGPVTAVCHHLKRFIDDLDGETMSAVERLAALLRKYHAPK